MVPVTALLDGEKGPPPEEFIVEPESITSEDHDWVSVAIDSSKQRDSLMLCPFYASLAWQLVACGSQKTGRALLSEVAPGGGQFLRRLGSDVQQSPAYGQAKKMGFQPQETNQYHQALL